MLEIKALATFTRCAVLEWSDGVGLSLGREAEIWLNGAFLRREERTVFSLYGLEPGRAYELRAVRGEGEAHCSFSTLPETALLDASAFGAVGDGATDCTAFLQAAILCCPENGTVRIGRGNYRTGPLFLKSHISLWLDEGAVLLAETDRKRYPVLPGMTETTDEKDEYNLGTWEGNPLSCFAALLTGVQVEGVDVFGPGCIDGRGALGDWWENVHEKRTAWRPFMLFFNRCKDIRVQGLMLRDACSWTVHPYYSRNLLFCGLTVHNDYHAPNSDGIDVDSCRDVELVGCDLSAGDDCVAIKSGKYYMSVYHPMATRNVTIRHCLMLRGHGAVVIGSETASGVYDVHVSRCAFRQTDRGLRIKTRRGRGGASVIDQITLEDVEMDGVGIPLAVNMFYYCDPDGHNAEVQSRASMPVSPESTPRIGRITARRVECKEVLTAGAYLFGLPEVPVECIELRQIKVAFAASPRAEIPLMMDGLEPVKGLLLGAHHVKRLAVTEVSYAGALIEAPALEDATLVIEGAEE